MGFIDFIVVGIICVIGYVLGTVYPLWQPEEELELEPDPEDTEKGQRPQQN